MTDVPGPGRESGVPADRPAGAALPPARDVLDSAPDSAAADRVRAVLRAFLAERRPERALALWFGPRTPGDAALTAARMRGLLVRDVARIDELISRQLDLVIHHPRFRRLEASWRGLGTLVDVAERYAEGDGPPVRVRILSLSWADFAKDLERAIEFDQSQIFRKVYEEEFGRAGGEPFGILLGDFEVSHRPRPSVSANDVDVLERMSHVAAAAFAPFVVGADPALLGLDRFSDLELPLDLARTFDLVDYLKWNTFRRTEDARFVAVTLPRVLARPPWEDDGTRADGFRYAEDVSAPDGSGYLWGTAVYAFGATVVRSFGETSWPADVRGVPDDGRAGGFVEDLTSLDLRTDAAGVVPRMPTDVLVTDRLEKELTDLGLLPLCAMRGAPWAAFYGTPSLQAARTHSKTEATRNARISAMLQYVLSVSRFAHFVKIIGREKIGSTAEAGEVQRFLHEWLMGYTTSDDSASQAMKARHPLRDARVEVRAHPSRPGSYLCVFHLRPHHQVDDVAATVKLVTEFSPARAG